MAGPRLARQRRLVCALSITILAAAAGCTDSNSSGRGTGQPGQPPIHGADAVRAAITKGTITANLRQLLDTSLAAVDAAPTDASAHGKLGMVCEANGFYAAGRIAYRQAATLDPRRPEWRLHEALCATEIGDTDDARRIFAEIVQAHPSFAPGWYRHGMALMLKGDTAAALSALRKAVQLSGGAPQAKVAVGNALVRQKKFAEAVQLLEPVLQEQPEFSHAHYVLGLGYRGLKDRPKSERHLQLGVGARLLHLEDSVARDVKQYERGLAAIMNKAVDAMGRGQVEPAIQSLLAAQKEFPDDVSLQNNLASGYLLTGRVDEAAAILGRALTLEPQNYRTFINLALVERTRGNLPLALQHADAAVRHSRRTTEALVSRAKVLLVMKNDAEVRPALEAILATDPDHAWASFHLADVCIRAGDWQSGLDAIRIALPNAQDRAAALAALVRCLAQVGHQQQAQKQLERLKKNFPGDRRIPNLDRLLQRKQDAAAGN